VSFTPFCLSQETGQITVILVYVPGPDNARAAERIARSYSKASSRTVDQPVFILKDFNRRFPEITGEDNLTVFSYSGRVKSPEWKWQRRRADLRHFEIFRRGPILIYTRLRAGGTYYPICTFPASSECLIGISDAFSAFVYGYPSSCPHAHCTPNKSMPTLRCTHRHIQVHARRLLTNAVPWISEDRLFM